MPEELRISVSQFKARRLRLLDELSWRRLRLLITKRGKPLARVEAADRAPLNVHGWLKGTARVSGDLTEPVGADWQVLDDSG